VRLRRLRLERGLSQRALAGPGVGYAYISRIEAGQRDPSMKVLRTLAAKLGVSPEYLETGRELGDGERRELRLVEAELALRLGDAASAEAQLAELAEEAAAAGDRAAASRALIALALAADERGQHGIAIAGFERAFAFERPSALVRLDVFATFGRACGALGQTAREIDLYRGCIDEVEQVAPDAAAVQARYRILLSYALSDAGHLGEAERVLREALVGVSSDRDPYMRIRVFWSLARLSEMEGRSSVALRYARRAIALLEATEDHVHRARAHLLAAWIMNSSGDGDGAREQIGHAQTLFGESAASDDLARLAVESARVEALAGDGAAAVRLAQASIDLLAGRHDPILGAAFAALAEGLALVGQPDAANVAYGRAVELLEQSYRWREADQACRSWARFLRDTGSDAEAREADDRAARLAEHSRASAAHGSHAPHAR
jgi:transcriptional regulator with XRE-family HTH domain